MDKQDESMATIQQAIKLLQKALIEIEEEWRGLMPKGKRFSILSSRLTLLDLVLHHLRRLK